MFSKIVIVLAMTSLAALAMRYFSESDDESVLQREVAGQLDALREHLFRR
ncbi:MAG TPA: hypothetical protein VIX59_03495 [Candidatus Binataceae bacterium]